MGGNVSVSIFCGMLHCVKSISWLIMSFCVTLCPVACCKCDIWVHVILMLLRSPLPCHINAILMLSSILSWLSNHATILVHLFLVNSNHLLDDVKVFHVANVACHVNAEVWGLEQGLTGCLTAARGPSPVTHQGRSCYLLCTIQNCDLCKKKSCLAANLKAHMFKVTVVERS